MTGITPGASINGVRLPKTYGAVQSQPIDPSQSLSNSVNPLASNQSTTNISSDPSVDQSKQTGKPYDYSVASASNADTGSATLGSGDTSKTPPLTFGQTIENAFTGEQGAKNFLSGVAGLATAAGTYFTEKMKQDAATDRQTQGLAQQAALQKQAIEDDIARRSSRGSEGGSNAGSGATVKVTKTIK